MKLENYINQTTDIDQDFKKGLQTRIQARYKKNNIFSKSLTYILGGVVLSGVALASPSIRENIGSFFNDLISPFYSDSKTILVQNFSSSKNNLNIIEDGRFLTLKGQNGQKDTILVASGSLEDLNSSITSGKNTIILSQNSINPDRVRKIFEDKNIANNFQTSLQQIIKNYLAADNSISQSNDWNTNLMLNMNIQENEKYINIVLQSYEEGNGAHPSQDSTSLWFDKKTGQKLNSQDLMAQNSFSQLSKFVLEKMVSQFPDQDKEFLQQGTEPTPENYQNLFLSGGKIFVLIPKYQALPGYLGEHSYEVPENLLK